MIPRPLSRSFNILRQEGLFELTRKVYSHTHLRKRFFRHPAFLKIWSIYLRWKRLRNPDRYTDANPFKTITVNPTEIEYTVTNIPCEWGTVIGGAWKRTRIIEKDRHQILKQHFVDGKSWAELPIDTELGRQKEIIYHRVKTDGYLSQQELEAERSLLSLRDTEIGVGIDQDGTIVHIGNGQHRLSIAKLLEVAQVPVQVRVRHIDWQKIRDEIRTTDSKNHLSGRAKNSIGHPDLNDLLKEKNWDD